VDVSRVLNALGSQKRLKLIELLGNGDLSAMDIYKHFRAIDANVHRETIYRDLERLVAADLISKYYEITNKKILYKLSTKKLVIDLVDLKVTYDRDR
jgi:Fe2+ or Zn2+ uptake regulation protein